MPKTTPIKNNKLKDKNIIKLVRIKRLSFFIPMKTLKKVNEVSKYFKSKTLAQSTNKQGMLYAQASKDRSNTESALKIKKAFLTLNANNINNIQQIIKSDGKPKPHINMITKDPSRKQIIISMNDVNRDNFIRDSNTHVTNMNKVLKNIKTDIMVNFVYPNQNNIIVITNKVASNSELQMVENCIKNTDHIIAESVETPRLPQSKFYLKTISIPFL